MTSGASTFSDWLEAWATVIAAMGTVGTLVWQAFALAQERRTRAEEVRELREERQRAKDAQARTIVLEEPGWSWKVMRDGTQKIVIQIPLGNYGPLPVTNVIGLVTLKSNKMVLGDGDEGRFLHVLAGGEKTTIFCTVNLADLNLPDRDLTAMALEELFEFDVTFTDYDGTQWAIKYGLEKTPRRFRPAR
jgi:hypothetical protein